MEGEGRRRISVVVQYDGTDFSGFQRQPNGRTIQEVLEAGLAGLLGHEVTVKGAGRTDAGVHARGQVISFLTGPGIPANKIPEAVRGFLPKDVAIIRAAEVPLEFDPQKDALAKTYCYRLWRGDVPDVLIDRYTHWWPGELDLALMESEAASLVGRHDFLSFRATGSSAKTTIREVKQARWVRKPLGERGEIWEFWISADGFLYKMVRLIVGTLVGVGRGQLRPGTVSRLLEQPGTGKAGQCAPAKGLCLERVTYPGQLGRQT